MADTHKLTGNSESWTKEIKQLRTPEPVQYFGRAAYALKGMAFPGRFKVPLWDTTMTGDELPEDAVEQCISPEALHILGGPRFCVYDLPRAMKLANAISRSLAEQKLQEDSGCADVSLILWEDVPLRFCTYADTRERNNARLEKCSKAFRQGMDEAGASGFPEPWTIESLPVSFWEPRKGESWRQAGERYGHEALRNMNEDSKEECDDKFRGEDD